MPKQELTFQMLRWARLCSRSAEGSINSTRLQTILWGRYHYSDTAARGSEGSPQGHVHRAGRSGASVGLETSPTQAPPRSRSPDTRVQRSCPVSCGSDMHFPINIESTMSTCSVHYPIWLLKSIKCLLKISLLPLHFYTNSSIVVPGTPKMS